MRKSRFAYISLLVFAALAGAWIWRGPAGKSALPEEAMDYNIHIRPILSDKCFACHGPDANAREAGLRLDIADSAYAALKDNPKWHAILPGDKEKSAVWQRIISQDPELVMPPPSFKLELTPDEVLRIGKWIDQGAVYKPHWAFVPPVKRPIPEVENKKWPLNEIDYFILSKMEAQGLKPSESADPERLLKRIALDITGLPPAPTLQERFLKDPSPRSYRKIVRELLASPHYGEKMAIAWMDLARYADSHGYQDDGLRTMWPWRDWVIHAFNKNYSYKKFVSWQLAGDWLAPENKEAILATGFNRNHKITQEGGVIDEEYRVEYVSDRTNTFGKAFLGLTFECAKCHDHKYDPLSQESYYQTYAFFNQVDEKGYQGDITLASLADPPAIEIKPEEVKEYLRFINLKDTTPVKVMVMKDVAQPRPTHILRRGAYDQPDREVSMGMPSVIFAANTQKRPANRADLAAWLFDPKNPLTARVYVNRVWESFFGRGLVKTSGDFGFQGDLPSHPELLDWLAVDFMEHGWDIKRLVGQIVNSATYQQSAELTSDHLKKDPENIYLSRAPRLRLSAELVKDLVLSSSGLLVPEIGGPSVKPYQPEGIWEATTSGRGQLATYVQDHGEALYRRGLYHFIKRTAPPPGMLTFDASTRDQCEVGRPRTNTPLQALILLNDPMVNEAARVFSERLLSKKYDPEKAIRHAFQSIVCREISRKELSRLLNLYREQERDFAKDPPRARQILNQGEYPHVKDVEPAKAAALTLAILTIYNLEESITKT
jgi:hypothetical protein